LQGEQVLLLCITGSMLVVLGILLVRQDLRRRAPEFVALRAIGWDPARMSSMLRAERTVTGLAAAAFAALSTVALGRVLEIDVTTTGYALAVGLAVASALLAGIRGPRSA
jgi:predicted lysophospholipase L1 biosynthesis ABC-type transport system permease subunit